MTGPPQIDFESLQIDCLLVSAAPNVRYLSGFTGSNGALIVTPKGQTLLTDPRYTIQASEEWKGPVRIVKSGPLLTAVANWIARAKVKRVGFERARLAYESFELLKERLPLGSSLVPTTGVIERLRMIKSQDEIDRIRRSVRTNSQAFEDSIKRIKPGISESEIAAELEYRMRRRGADKAAFETIVAAGPHSALPHARPTDQKIRGNELVLIDMGSCQDGYTSDMTRVVYLGKPNQKTRSMYGAVLEAQLAGIAAIRAGVTAEQVDRKARQVLAAHGLAKEFVHSTGHGLGLEIHEAPRLGKKDKTKLAEGMVVTIEPGAYVAGQGGIRIEDTVLVTNTGCEVLTPTSKELMLL